MKVSQMTDHSFFRPRISNFPAAIVKKWNRDLLIEGFVPFPKRLLRCLHRLFAGENGLQELQVVLAWADYQRPSVVQPPSIEYLAFIAGLTVGQVDSALSSLQDRGLIAVERQANWVVVKTEPLFAVVESLAPLEPLPGETEDGDA